MVAALERSGLVLSRHTLAEIYYAAGDFARSVELWDVAKKTAHPRYRRAKAASESFPNKIAPLYELNEFDTIVQECARFPNLLLSPAFATLAGKAHLKVGDLAGAARHFETEPKRDDLLLLANAAVDRGDRTLAGASIARTIGWALARGEWDYVIAWIRDGGKEWPQGGTRQVRELAAAIRRDLEVVVVRGLARCNLLKDLPWDNPKARFNQRPISEHLRRRFLAKDAIRSPDIPMLEVAAAIEFAGNRQDSLAMYEQLRADVHLTEAERTEAARRWIACKERQARWESESGSEGRARHFMTDADVERRRIGLKAGDSPSEWPDFGSLPEFVRTIRIATTTVSSALETVVSPPADFGNVPGVNLSTEVVLQPPPLAESQTDSVLTPIKPPIDIRLPGTEIDAKVFVSRQRILLVDSATGDRIDDRSRPASILGRCRVQVDRRF